MRLHSAIAIAAGNLVYDVHVLYPAATTIYAYIVKNGTTSYRSGIFKILIA
jgi:hypothetical protein